MTNKVVAEEEGVVNDQGGESGKVDKFYTYMVTVTFNMQFTFTEDEVEPTDGGRPGDFDPTSEALEALEEQVKECIEQSFSINELEAYADSDSLLGVEEG